MNLSTCRNNEEVFFTMHQMVGCFGKWRHWIYMSIERYVTPPNFIMLHQIKVFVFLLFSKVAGEPGTRRTLTVGPSSSLVADTICPGCPAWGCSLRCSQWGCPGRGWRSPQTLHRPRRPPGGYSQQNRSPTPGRWSPRRPRGVRSSPACCRAAVPPAGCLPPSGTAPRVAALGWSLGGVGGGEGAVTALFNISHSTVRDQFYCVTLYHLNTSNTLVCTTHFFIFLFWLEV